MAELSASRKWSFTSTGAGKAYDVRGYSRYITFGVETSSGSTAHVQILHRMGSSLGPYSVLSTVISTLGEFVTSQFVGPLEWVKPRVVDKTAGGSTNTVTVYLQGN